MHKLIDYTCDELKRLEKKVDNGQQLSSAELQYADVLAHLKKNLLKGEEMMGEEEGYSNRGYSRVYDDGYSNRYSRARGRYGTKRDSMGRYSRRDGYSMADEHMMTELRGLMEDAPDERTRQEFQSFISKLESM